MNRIRLLLVLAPLALCACTGAGSPLSSEPQCSDANVKELAIEISSDELPEQLFRGAIRSHLGTSLRMQGNPTYAQWKQLDDPNVIKLIAYVDAQMAELALTLDAIRTDDINHEIQKVECAADLLFGNGNKYPSPTTPNPQMTERHT